MKAEREAWRAEFAAIDPSRLVFLDETGATTAMTRTRGRAPRGRRLRAAVPHGHWKVVTLTAAVRLGGVGACLAFDYVDRRGQATRRTVEPHGLLAEVPAWYLLCRDRERRAVRMFRLDRMRRARVLEGDRFRPDLEAVHREWLAQRAEEGTAAPGRSG